MLDVINYISDVSVFMLASWNSGFNHFFDPKALGTYLEIIHDPARKE